jgi:Protein of unknown function (DUF3306)
MSRDDENLFARWSRRKRAVAEADAPAPAAELPEEPLDEDALADPEDEAALLERLGLPVPEMMGKGDDFSGFLKSGVPEFLRRRALRVLWRSNPVLANLDGLNDYDDDFTSPELTKKIIATGYKVGRGFLREVLAEEDTPLTTETANTDKYQDEVIADDNNIPKDLEPIAALADQEPQEVETETPPDPRPRRMRFET